MSNGLLKATLTLSTSSVVRSTYPWTGRQGKQLVVRSIVLVSTVLAILMPSLDGGLAYAGAMKRGSEMATAAKYFDWGFAQKVWFEMNTWEREEAEWAKYAADFNPWLALYKKDPRKAFDALDKMPKAQRLRVQRGYDMQLAYDQWFDHVYSTWYNTYPQNAAMAPVLKKAAPTFDDVLAARAQTASCHPESMLNECGPIPDWRSPEWKVKERGMMADAAKYVAEQEAKKGK